MENNFTVLDHIAIAVRDLEAAVRIYEDMGFTFSKTREKVESQGVEVAFAPMGGGHLELLRPLSEDGPVGKFIAKKGEGIHHICFEVKDVAKLCGDLSAKGYQFLYDSPVPGARDCLVNFIHPKSTRGVLVELLQRGPRE